MSKKILTNVFLLVAINLLIKPFWILGIDRTVQNTVGNDIYGAYMVMFNISLMFTMLLDFGINNYTSSFIAKHNQLLSKRFASLFPLKLVFAVAYLAVTFCFGFLFGVVGKQLWFLLLLALNQVLAFFILFFRANISGLQLFKTDAFLSVTDRGMMIFFAIMLMLVYNGNFSIEHFILSQSLGYSASFIISFWVLKKPLQGVKLNFRKVMMWSMIRQSWPYALLALLMTFYMRADILMMKKLLPNGDEQNGVYAVANRLLEAANMLAVLLAGMLLPLFSKMIKSKQDLSSLIKMSMTLLILPAVGVAAISWFYHMDLMMLLSKTSPVESGHVFKYVMISFVAMCVMYIFGTLLTANGNISLLNKLAAMALIINLTVNLFLQPQLGAKGAALAAIFTHSFIALTNMYFAIRNLKIELNVSYLVRFFAVLATVTLSVGLVHYRGINLSVAIGSAIVSAIIMLFITRLFHIQQLKQLLQSRV
jgi:O-antigen/teichoic acid export membrane protein